VSYRLPPLNGLRAFEAAGRHLSFKAAARELSVTPGAVSQQVKHLEQALGVPLFQRLHRSLILTAQGEALLPEVAGAFERLSEASDTVAKALKTKPLRLGISPALSDEPDRLLARLAGTKRPPDYVRAVATDDVTDLLSGRVDALLRAGPGPLSRPACRSASAHAPLRSPQGGLAGGLARPRPLPRIHPGAGAVGEGLKHDRPARAAARPAAPPPRSYCKHTRQFAATGPLLQRFSDAGRTRPAGRVPAAGVRKTSQKQPKSAHVLQFSSVGTAAQKRGEVLDPLHVVMLSFWRQLAYRHIFDHPPTKRTDSLLGHRDAPVLSEVVGTPRSQVRTRPVPLWCWPPNLPQHPTARAV
jgi:LysR family glycine cleavage system transcriptional activator